MPKIESESKDDRPRNPSRRRFFAGVVTFPFTAVTTAPVLAPAGLMLGYQFGAIDETLLRIEAQKPEIREDIDPLYRNVGVSHSRATLDEYGDTLQNYIDEADVVLFESISAPDFFQPLYSYASDRGKDARSFDTFDKSLTALLSLGFTLFSMKKGLDMFGSPPVFSSKEDSKKWLFSLLKSFTSSEFGLAPVTMLPSFMHSADSENRYTYGLDPSYILDGRTVFMTEVVNSVLDLHPTKKVLSISGDGHATGIQYYRAPENRAQYTAKRILYNIIYAPHKHLP